MFFSIIEACTFNVWASAVGGSYLTGMAVYLGAGGFALGILGSLGALSTMLQLVSAPFVVGIDWRRNFLALFSALQRFCGAFAGIIALLILPSNPKLALIVFVGLNMLAWAFMAPSTVVWQGYMTDLVPAEIRGRYFAKRNAWSTVATMIVVLVYGTMLDHWKGEAGFWLLYVAAFVGAAMNLGAWFLLPELPPGEIRSTRPFWESIRIPMAKPGPHRTVTLFFAAWAFAQGLAAPFYSVALVQKLHISFGLISVLATIASLTTIVAAQFWGRMQDRIGQHRAISLLALMHVFVPLLYIGGKVGGFWILVAAHMLQGIAGSGMGLANTTINMHLAPLEDRGSYFAFFAAAGGLTGFVTPVLVGPLTSQYLNVLFVISAASCLVLSLVWRMVIQPRMEPYFGKTANR
jgi:MFS family permease